MPDNQSIWTSIARYCTELAPVIGPLLSAAGETAEAIERASIADSKSSSAARLVSYESD